MRPLTVALSGINAVDNPGPGVGVARALKEDPDLDVRIVGLAYDAMEPGIYMDWLVDRAYMVPYPSAGFEAYLNRLLEIKAEEDFDFLLPNLDTELPMLIRHRDTLSGLGIATFLPTADQFRMRGKDRLKELADAIGLLLPKTEVVTSQDELAKAVDRIGLPVMIKGAFYKAKQVHSQLEAAGAFSSIVAQWGYPIVVQEVVKGDELNVVAVGDGQGGTLGRVAVKKMWITELGKIWTGVTIRHEAMLEATDRFMSVYQWRGPFELECMVDGDKVYLIEINPRFPAWSYLATGVGINLPSRLLRRALGLTVPEGLDYEPGKLFIRYTYEMVTDRRPFENMITRGRN